MRILLPVLVPRRPPAALATLVAFLLLVAAGRPAAQPIPDANAVPKLDAAGRASYANFLMVNLPRAFAVGGQGAFGWQGGRGTLETARARALESCAAKGAADCTVYAENLNVVWQGRAPRPSRRRVLSPRPGTTASCRTTGISGTARRQRPESMCGATALG